MTILQEALKRNTSTEFSHFTGIRSFYIMDRNIVTPLDFPVLLLKPDLTNSRDIVNSQLVCSKFRESASWDGVRVVMFKFVPEADTHMVGRRLSIRLGTATFKICESEGPLDVGILRTFWEHCRKLEMISIKTLLPWYSLRSSADVRLLLSEMIRSLQQEIPRNIKWLTNGFPNVVGSSNLLDLWRSSLHRIKPGKQFSKAFAEIPDGSLAELDSTILILVTCTEL